MAAAAFIIYKADFIMEDVVFTGCDFSKLETPSSPPKKNIF
jgi:hypothetical protein